MVKRNKSLMIPDGWIETKLGEVVEIASSKRIYADEYLASGIPFYRGKEIIEKYNGNNVSTELFISKVKFNEIKERFGVPKPGDILLTSVGTLGIPYIVQENEDFYFKDGNLTWFKHYNGIDNKFLFYWFISDFGKEQLMKNTIGSTQQALTIVALNSLPILLPPLSEQKEIADILSSLDDKIELLREENKTLEAIAQTIFKEWFVNFNFPDENGQSYKSSGGKMIDSELGEIPEGWKVGKLGDEFRVVMGQSPEGESYNETGEGIIFFQGRTDFKERFPEVRLYTTSPKRIAEKFDVLVSVRAPVGDINLASERCCIGRGLCALRSNLKSYALYKIKTLKNIFNNFEAEGTVFGSINKNSMLNIEVVIPSDDLLFRFEEKVNTLDQKIYNNHLQIKSLSTLRDNLLPKLLCKNVRMKGLK